MTNVTVPLPPTLLEFVDSQVSDHKADSRSGFIRRLIAERQEHDLLEAHREAMQEYGEKKTFKGDLRAFVTKK